MSCVVCLIKDGDRYMKDRQISSYCLFMSVDIY